MICVIENAYDECKDKLQDLSPVIRNTRIQNIFKTEKSLPILNFMDA
jgi:hypothetical protein